MPGANDSVEDVAPWHYEPNPNSWASYSSNKSSAEQKSDSFTDENYVQVDENLYFVMAIVMKLSDHAVQVGEYKRRTGFTNSDEKLGPSALSSSSSNEERI